MNVISPGPTDTELFKQGKSQQDIQRFSQLAALGRLGIPRTLPKLWLYWSAMMPTGSLDRTFARTAGLSEYLGDPTNRGSR